MPPCTVTPLILTKQWITPTKSEVTIQPLALFGEIHENQEPTESVNYTQLAEMERKARKPSLSPRNPSDLRKQKNGRRSRHSSDDDSWDIVPERKTSRNRSRPSNNLNVPGVKSRSISPRLEELSRASSRRSSSRRSSDRNIDLHQNERKQSDRKSSKSPAQNRTKEKAPYERSRRKYDYTDEFSDSSEEWRTPRRRYSGSPRRKQYYGEENIEKDNKRNRKKATKAEKSKSKPKKNSDSSPRPRSNRSKPSKSPRRYENVVEDDYVNFPTSTGSETIEDSRAPGRPLSDKPLPNENLEVCNDDPWGANSPRRRIETMEASFKESNSNTEQTNSDKELEEEIYNEAVKKNKFEENTENIPFQESKIAESYMTSDHNETDIYEASTEYVGLPSTTKENRSSEKIDQFLLQAYKDDEKDSCLGLSLGDLNSSRSSEPPSSDIIINLDSANEAKNYNDAKLWTFLPLPGEVPLLLGKVRDEETGDIFNVFKDGPIDTTRSVLDDEEDREKEDDIRWCSVYFCVRIVGLALVGAALGSLIWVAQL
jgi:hypothetical protein